jgi:predicted deacylase
MRPRRFSTGPAVFGAAPLAAAVTSLTLVTRLLAGLLVLAGALAAPTAAHAARDPFHDVRALNARLRELRDAHPATTRLVTVATVEHGEVLALEVDPSGRFSAATPGLLLQGGVHGNEWISTEVVLRLAELVSEAAATAWPAPVRLDGLIYRFVPVVNLDGFATGNRLTVEPGGQSYDPNREFPVPGQPDHRSRPLIQALRDYTRAGNLVAVLDYHSAAECVLWPWAYSPTKQPPEADALAEVSRAMAASVGYCSGQVANVIPYRHQGTAADWYQSALKAPAILVELAAADEPGSQAVAQILLDQERPFWIFLAWLERRGLKPPAPPRPASPASPLAPASPGSPASPSASPSGTSSASPSSSSAPSTPAPAPPSSSAASSSPAAPPAASCRLISYTLGAPPLGYRATGQLCAGLREGAWDFRFLSGGPLRQGGYHRGLEEGAWRTYHPDGGTQDVGQYVGGKPEGFWQRHAADGTLIEARGYTAGQRQGVLVRWTDDGALWQVRWCRLGPCRTICKVSGKQGCLSPSGPGRARKRSRSARR